MEGRSAARPVSPLGPLAAGRPTAAIAIAVPCTDISTSSATVVGNGAKASEDCMTCRMLVTRR